MKYTLSHDCPILEIHVVLGDLRPMTPSARRYKRDREKMLAYSRAWYARNPGYKRQYRTKQPLRELYLSVKSRAKVFGIAFTLTREDIVELCAPMRCAVTGHRLFWAESTKRRYNPWQPSIDQIKPRAGYTKGNTRVVSVIYNLCKNHWTDDIVAQFRGSGP